MPTTSGMDFSKSPERNSTETHINHLSQTHSLGVLGNLSALNMDMSSLQTLQSFNLQHTDVLEKLKMQVRDMKVNLIDPEYIHGRFGIQTPPNSSFPLPSQLSLSSSGVGGGSSRHELPQNLSASNGLASSFTPPGSSSNKDANSPPPRDSMSSPPQNSNWSFEEQFKQVRQLYEINDDPKRKEFLDDLFSFMQRRGTPINRLPIMAKSVLDLYELYNLVIARGGLVDVINKKLWQEIIKGLHLPSSITSAAFTLRTQYMKYLYPYECEKKNLSNPSELQAAIDGNKREGRRSSYGQFDSQIQNQLQLPQLQRSPVSSGMQQLSPLSLVTHGGSQAARLMGAPSVGQMPNLMSHEIEQRMMEYIKLFQPQQKRSQSPDLSTNDAMNALEMSRVALWRNMYSNTNGSPPTSMNPAGSPSSNDSRFNNHAFPDHATIKRERDMSGGDYTEHDFSQPPAKRATDFGRASLNEILAAAAASNGMCSNGARNSFHPGSLHEEEDEEEEEEEDRDQDDRNADDIEVNEAARNRDAVNKNRVADSFHHLPTAAMMSHPKRQSPPAFRPGNNCDDSEDDEEDQRNRFMPNMFGGLQFKITKAGISESGEPELVVSMEINNVTYEGSLFAAATKKNLKLHKVAHKHHTSSPVKSTTSSTGSAVTTQMVSPKNMSNGSHHNNNEADVMNNNCLSKNPHFLEPEVQIHSPPSPVKAAPRIGPKIEETSFDEATSGRMDEGDDDDQNNCDAEEDLSMKPKKLSHLDEIRVVGSQHQPMVSS